MSSMYRDIRQRLIDAGCQLVRQGKGSHEIWHSPINDRNFTVPKSLADTSLANAILKQAGLPKAF
ncbi:MAG: type II toxin-antitoxin system HicA family toxin [Candidatus Competibacteraceae bacterium]|uniref:YcfA family protein n=1 Tax=Candidatus Contendobacter odensis Run_B_J11 TaxID=1400861 RepID=A0A7U7GAZ2_9GAMM|nr:type II toxin-antitoxin system HicA family toxin [Candidatus Contendobacter odensis]MBK8535430.1 type II toxin-antitoxin system HicA family toxin [Candidatus Competibacteraceae bacterium]MBK8752602.1 type II toxin-antitoxin system HicA family toxin [Candidatus Competibacteraceae bacterium]CDH45087.1 YcfA family protein [Candidatus Contendobacter odensis Run_B_J11]